MNDRKRKIDRPYVLHESAAPLMTSFVIVTHWGLVMVHVDKLSTEVRFVHDGRMYTRFFAEAHKVRRCITLADKFADEVKNGGVE